MSLSTGIRPNFVDLTSNARPKNVLVVEDDPGIRHVISSILNSAGFAIFEADGVQSAVEIASHTDIIVAVIDLHLADGDGLELTRKLSNTRDIATIIVSGQASPVDRTIGIEVGADDYMAKPFDARELLARVKRQASRMARFRDTPEPAETGENHPNQPLGEWTVDFARRRVTSNDGRQARLSDAEFRALEALLIQRGTIVSRDDIHEAVVGHRDRDPLDRRVDVLISCIRRKLKLNELSNIRTVHRVGYIID